MHLVNFLTVTHGTCVTVTFYCKIKYLHLLGSLESIPRVSFVLPPHSLIVKLIPNLRVCSYETKFSPSPIF